METVQSYLLSEKFLVLSAGLIGLVSFILGFAFLFFLPQFKSFALTMIILGGIEMAVFMPTYVKSGANIRAKIEMYSESPESYTSEQLVFSKNALRSFFTLKIVYAVIILVLVITISKLNTGSIFIGILTALIIHLASGITIDNFGEIYTKKYNSALVQLTE
ncbi:hypothetical protein N9954_02775 [Maribacter sp.]|nr:hypothetical protein [Maribacter sp.]